MLESVLEWVLLVSAIVLVATIAPGYLILRMFSFLADTGPMQAVIYSVGVSLVVVPLAIYWANFLGVPINLAGILIVLAVVLSAAALGNIVVAFKRRRAHLETASLT